MTTAHIPRHITTHTTLESDAYNLRERLMELSEDNTLQAKMLWYINMLTYFEISKHILLDSIKNPFLK